MRILVKLVLVASVALLASCAGSKPPMYEPPAEQEVGSVAAPSLPPIYRIDYGDTLQVRFLYHPELDAGPVVRPDGQVSIPGLGDFYATGLTPDELAADITRRASITNRNPIVTVLVREFAPQQVYVGGMVWRPGYVRLRPGMTTLRAVYERGGFTRAARVDSVVHIAWRPEGGYSAQRLDLAAVLDTGDTSQDIALGPNDVVYVPSSWVADAGVFVEQWIINLIPIREPTARFPTIGN